jgi:hypothetical protein
MAYKLSIKPFIGAFSCKAVFNLRPRIITDPANIAKVYFDDKGVFYVVRELR